MKKQHILFLFLILVSCCCCGCNEDKVTEDTDTSLTAGTEINSSKLLDYGNMLNAADEDVIAMLGEGDASYQDEGNTTVATRLYQSNLLGFGGEAVLIYNEEENPTVHEVLITFSGAQYDDVIDAISQQLGDAAFSGASEGENPDAQWNQEDTVYNLTSYEGTIMLGIWQDYGTPSE